MDSVPLLSEFSHHLEEVDKGLWGLYPHSSLWCVPSVSLYASSHTEVMPGVRTLMWFQ